MTESRPDDPHIIQGSEAIERFLTAGRALFTIRNTETGNRVTYRVKRPKGADYLEVYALCGPDNTDHGNYRLVARIVDGVYEYRGMAVAVREMREAAREADDQWAVQFGKSILECLENGVELSYGREKALHHNLNRHKIAMSDIPEDDMKQRVFRWLWNAYLSRGRELPEQVEVWHEGCCARCGRRLTVPSSIESGFGPECILKVAC